MYRFSKPRTLFGVRLSDNLLNLRRSYILSNYVPKRAFSSISCVSISLTNQLLGKTSSQTTQPPKKKKKPKAMPPRPLWLINEDEIEEKFIKGGGPGGQKINKSNIKVQITHKPTGLVINSQESRSQEKNRAKAREILALRLEQMQNPETCRLNVLAEKVRTAKRNRAKKAAKKHKKRDNEEVTEILSAPENESKLDSISSEQQ